MKKWHYLIFGAEGWEQKEKPISNSSTFLFGRSYEGADCGSGVQEDSLVSDVNWRVQVCDLEVELIDGVETGHAFAFSARSQTVFPCSFLASRRFSQSSFSYGIATLESIHCNVYLCCVARQEREIETNEDNRPRRNGRERCTRTTDHSERIADSECPFPMIPSDRALRGNRPSLKDIHPDVTLSG